MKNIIQCFFALLAFLSGSVLAGEAKPVPEIYPVQVFTYSVAENSELQKIAVFNVKSSYSKPFIWKAESSNVSSSAYIRLLDKKKVLLLYQPEEGYSGEELITLTAEDSKGKTGQFEFIVSVEPAVVSAESLKHGGGKLILVFIIVLLLFMLFRLSERAIKN